MYADESAKPSTGMILLLGALTAFGAVSIDLYLPSMPAIGREFAVRPDVVQRSMAAFFIGMAVGQLIYGPLSDRFGRRRPLLAGIAIYIVASLGCAVAPSIDWLIAGRLVQALGACAGIVIARAIVRDLYDHRDSARIFSLLVLVLGVAPMIAPTVGGWIVSVASWRVIFYVLTGFGVLVGAGVLLTLSESRSHETHELARGETALSAYAGLLRRRRLLGYVLAGALSGACLFTYIAVAPTLLIDVWGFSPRQFGWLFALMAVGVIGSSQVNRRLLLHHPSDQILAVASLCGVATGLSLLLVAATGAGGKWGVLAMLFLTLTSYGFMAANTQAGALSIDPLRAGSTSALVGAASFAAGALASTVAALFHDATAVPMAAVMAASLTGAALALFRLALPRETPLLRTR